MDKNYKKILIPSLVLNGILIVAAIFFFFKGYHEKINIPFMRDYYLNKVTHFQTLHSSGRSIVFIGDSLTDRCEWGELLDRCDVINRGIDADTTDGVLNRISDVTKLKPKKIFIMIGGNDFVIGRKVPEIMAFYKKIIERIRIETPETIIYIQSVLPTVYHLVPLPKNYITDLNSNLKSLADNYTIFYVDIYSRMLDDRGDLNASFTLDGAHLNGIGYLVWREAIYQYLK